MINKCEICEQLKDYGLREFYWYCSDKGRDTKIICQECTNKFEKWIKENGEQVKFDKIIKAIKAQSDRYASKDCYVSFHDLYSILESLGEKNEADHSIDQKHQTP